MKVWKYGDDINTDMLFPGKYTYTCATPEEIRPHLLEDLDPGFSKEVKPGDIILAGKNFGCGSSREQPVVGFKNAGIKAIVARSFSRIFYRASLNQGLLLIESPQSVDAYTPGDQIKINAREGEIRVGEKTFCFPQLPESIMGIREAGGLLEYTRRRLAKNLSKRDK